MVKKAEEDSAYETKFSADQKEAARVIELAFLNRKKQMEEKSSKNIIEEPKETRQNEAADSNADQNDSAAAPVPMKRGSLERRDEEGR